MRARYDDGGPSDPSEYPSIGIIDKIVDEVNRQHELAHGGNTAAFDATMSRNDFLAVINAYLGRAGERVFRNQRENIDHREMMIKAAATIVSALVAEEYKSTEGDPEEAF